jgi:membrane associated rhomboid family serine protease
VLANVVVYVLAIVHGGGFFSGPSQKAALEHGAIPAKLTVEAFFTSTFVSASFPQLLANTIALALFGLNVEDAMGRARFLLFYLLGGLAALLLTVLFEPASAALLIGVWLVAQVWLGLAGQVGPIGGDWALAYAGQIGALMLAWPAIRMFADRARYAAKRRQPPPQPVY